MYDQAVAVVLKTRRASISLVQRHLRIGYNRAARLLEQMEKSGLVSPMQTNGNRDILVPRGRRTRERRGRGALPRKPPGAARVRSRGERPCRFAPTMTSPALSELAGPVRSRSTAKVARYLSPRSRPAMAPARRSTGDRRARGRCCPTDYCGPTSFVDGCDVLTEYAMGSWRIYFHQYRLRDGQRDWGGLDAHVRGPRPVG